MASINTVTQNVKIKAGEKIILMHEQFPSNVYPWMRLAEENDAELVFVQPPETMENRGEIWNQRILNAIDDSVAVVAMANVHWADGTWFDLRAIRAKSKQHGALLILDGTQSVGALPFDVQEIQPDALICAAYKWLMGPYSTGLAYYGEYFDNGTPLEENWVNRKESYNFQNLVNYQPKYEAKANRFSVGEQANFILVPMLTEALRQLNEWGVDNVQKYCEKISGKAIEEMQKMGLILDTPPYRKHHLFGVRLTPEFDMEQVKKAAKEANLLISYRGNAIRISPNVYNEEQEFDLLLACFKKAKV